MVVFSLIMPDNKQHCKNCKTRHPPPTGKKCQHKKSLPEEPNELSRDAAVASGTSTSRGSEDGQLLQKHGTRKDTMISYLADLMEDATDFTWQRAKASHAVLLCEMERGTLQWEDGDRIDRIRRAHAQKHISVAKSAWAKNEKKPWFCKNFQSNSCTHQKDHEVNGRLNKHICAFCLTLGKQLNHSEKNCLTKQNSKNEQTAVNR